jgi:hypothetical protein
MFEECNIRNKIIVWFACDVVIIVDAKTKMSSA